MHTFTVFKTETCPYCQQTVAFLDALQESRDDVKVRLVDANGQREAFAQVARAVGRSTVPQIFVDDKYVGGWTELSQAAARGRLDAYLDGEPWTPAATPNKKRSWWPFGKRRAGADAPRRDETPVEDGSPD